MNLINNDINKYINLFYKKYPTFNIIEYKKFNNIISNNNINILYNYDISDKNNIICSVKDFYNKYPDFDLIIYKLFNKELNMKNIELLIHWHNIGINQNKISSIKNIINKYNIDIDFIKLFYVKFFNNTYLEILTLIYYDKDSYIFTEKDFDTKYSEFNIEIYKSFNDNLLFDNDIKYKSYWYHNHINDSNIIYSINSFYKIYSYKYITIYKNIYNLYYINDIEIIKNSVRTVTIKEYIEAYVLDGSTRHK